MEQKFEVNNLQEVEMEDFWVEYVRTFEVTVHDPIPQSIDYPNTKCVSAKMVKAIEREHAYLKGFKPFTEPVSAEREESIGPQQTRYLEEIVSEREAKRLGLVTKSRAEYDGD